ncbi:hypothetical protein [Chloroflexus sp.]|uniref:hypothetical protein n=1 Tax=Chloroflexus sp. TaxID=1904827 RepID=UPI002611A824|nr:hypothetical protein [uncultured Chloroflexus sp.]
MTDDLSFTLDLPPEERETLMALIRSAGIDAQAPKLRDTDWQTIIAIIGGIGTVASSISALIELADKLNTWRTTMRRQGKTPHGRLRRSGQPPLDLATATDEEVLQWLLRTPPKG